MGNKDPAFILYINSIISELEMYLPVYEQINSSNEKWQLVIVYNNTKNYEEVNQNDFLIEKLKKFNAKTIVIKHPNVKIIELQIKLDELVERVFKKKFFSKIIALINAIQALNAFLETVLLTLKTNTTVKVIAFNHATGNQLLKGFLAKFYTKALTVAMPHGEMPRATSDCDKKSIKQSVDLVILPTSDYSLKYYKKYFNNGYNQNTEFVVTGSPRLDQKWVNQKLSFYKLTENNYNIQIPEGYKKILLLTRHAHKNFFEQKTWEALFDDVCRTVFSYENSFLIVKPHPREDAMDIEALLKRYSSKNWLVSRLDKLILIEIADIVVSMLTSATIDVLQRGKPVIEHFLYTNYYDGLLKNENGITSPYRAYGLVAASNNKEQLQTYISQFYDHENNPEKVWWKSSRQSYIKYVGDSNEAAQKAASAILKRINL